MRRVERLNWQRGRDVAPLELGSKGETFSSRKAIRKFFPEKTFFTRGIQKEVFAREIIGKFSSFLKKAQKKHLFKSIGSVIEYLPPEVCLQLAKQLGVPIKNFDGLVAALSERIIFVPQKEFVLLSTLVFGKKARLPPAFSFKEHAFVNLFYGSKENLFNNSSHELVHLVRMITGLPLNYIQDEALAVSLGLYARAIQTPRMRADAINSAKKVYRTQKESDEYIAGVNLGRRAFLEAMRLHNEISPKAAKLFFFNLFRSNEFSGAVINLAAKEAEEGK